MRNNDKKIGEISIPVPWGHLAAKTWGEDIDPLILCVHGVLDNASSFDRLIPHLPSSYYYVSIDLPGHGKSSHFPNFLPIHTLNFIFVYREITKFFKKKFIILGHSYGGQLGLLYAQMYPKYVEKLIMLDTVTMHPVTSDYYIDYLREHTENHLKINENLLTKQPPTYTRQEALAKVQHNRNYSSIKQESAEALLERSIEPVGDKFKFTIDQRMKNFINPLRDNRYIIEIMKANPVMCPVLIILGNKNIYQLQILEPVIKFIRTRKNVKLYVVEGNHDVHSDHPERLFPYVNTFLLTQKGKL